MNKTLYSQLVKQHQDSATVSSYFRSKDWVEGHLFRLCTEFGWLSVGTPVKHTICGITRVSKVESFIVNEHNILVNVGFGNIWYYECRKPKASEVKKFDGHCLVID